MSNNGNGEPVWQVPPTSSEDRWVGGVASGLAAELGVNALAVRTSFLILALAGGWGIVLYGLSWLAMNKFGIKPDLYQPHPKGNSASQRLLALAMMVVGSAILFLMLSPGNSASLIVPAGLIATGFFIAWSYRKQEAGAATLFRASVGMLITLVGVVALFASLFSFQTALLLSLPIVSVALIAMAIVAPAALKLGRGYDSERQERIRIDERANVAAHLHDSVLQTLTVIQNGARNENGLTAKEMASLARRQELELRSWLNNTDDIEQGASRLQPSLENVVKNVETDYDIKVGLVVAGDSNDLRPQFIDPLISATREAIINAAKHSEASTVDVFAELTDTEIVVFVRDAGVGFDWEAFSTDDTTRRGLKHSVIERISRSGGTATISSQTGEGTEVEMHLPVSAAAFPAETAEPQNL